MTQRRCYLIFYFFKDWGSKAMLTTFACISCKRKISRVITKFDKRTYVLSNIQHWETNFLDQSFIAFGTYFY